MLRLSRRLLALAYDPTQMQQMNEHQLLLVDKSDKIIGTASKYEAHQISTAQLHRAFSLFVFNHDKSKLLLQKRSPEKITFPELWTNTCCSHPRNSPDEVGGVDGVILAAQRRLLYEMNMDLTATQLSEREVKFLTKIMYRGDSCETWVEKEMDYGRGP